MALKSEAVWLEAQSEKTKVSDYLGPAVVLETGAQTLRVELPAGPTAQAQMALAFPYEAAVGDVVLVITREDRAYVIGVIHGTGQTVLSLPGDVALRAANGQLRLSGDTGVVIDGPEVSLHATKLRMVASNVVQRFANVCQRVSDLLSVRAGQSHTVTEGSSYTQSKSAAIITEETVTINGKAVHLG
jgi:hypothetical protein